jgi:thymidylate synthase (FAD)
MDNEELSPKDIKFVKLISSTEPSSELQFNNITDAQDLIAFCARVSNPANQYNTETSEKLINYLIEHKHWSPLEMVDVTVEIETTRDIGRQILRHRSFVFQEFCLSGDSEIHFAVPCKLKKGSYKPTRKMKLSELYDKWENGAKSIKHSHNKNIEMRMPLRERIKNMNIKCFDEITGELTTSHIKEIFYTGKKELYEITLSDGKKIKTTKEHKFLTKEGFLPLEEVVGLKLANGRPVMTKKMDIGVNGIPLYQDKKWLEEKKKESIFHGGGLRFLVEKYGINYNTLKKWIKKHDLKYTTKEISIITGGPWNKGVFGYSTGERSEETRRKQSDSARKGSDSNFWRGGGSKKRKGIYGVDALSFRRAKNHTCENCGKYGEATDIHHIIPVSVNPLLENEKSNWQLLCRECHIEHHKNNRDPGWQAMAAKSRKQSAFTIKWCSIEKIEYIGIEDTYDIEIDHASHNYVANGIVVHNSQRYADATKELSMTPREARFQDTKNRQNSLDLDLNDEHHRELAKEWLRKQQEVIRLTRSTYEWAINNGLAKEVARAVLPEGITGSRMYMKGSIRSWIHFISVRTDESTQKEHREIALAIAYVIAKIFPLSVKFIEQGKVG